MNAFPAWNERDSGKSLNNIIRFIFEMLSYILRYVLYFLNFSFFYYIVKMWGIFQEIKFIIFISEQLTYILFKERIVCL